jgi:signal transduction histidine kinase
MRFAPVEHMFKTLRFRLTFWNTVAILVLVSAALWGVREGLRWTLQRELDNLLAEEVKEVRLTVEHFDPHWPEIIDELERMAESHRRRGWYVRLFDANGRVRWASSGAPAVETPLLVEAPRGAFNRGEYRLRQETIARPGRVQLFVRVGFSQAEVDEDVWRLTEMIGVAFGVILVVAPLSGWWLAGRATRPLATILHTTARLHPDHLVERLPLRGSGDELDRLSATINGFLDRLAAHLEQQRTFVANAAHELRSPLAAMRTSVEVALEHERTADEYRELLADLVEECAGLGNLVGHLLLLAEGDAGLLRADEAVPLDRLAARAVDMFQGIAEQRGLALRAGVLKPAAARGDAIHLREVIHNLLDNALKFTPAGGSVTVDVCPGPGEKSVLLRVSDTGQGIAPEDLPNVFERFYRADKARRRGEPTGGHGLGLSICQAIVTAYGGRIALDSTPGRGTTATVSLPAAS